MNLIVKPNKEKDSTLMGSKKDRNMQGIRQQENKSMEYSARNTKEK